MGCKGRSESKRSIRITLGHLRLKNGKRSLMVFWIGSSCRSLKSTSVFLSWQNTLLLHHKFIRLLLCLISIVTTIITSPQNSLGQTNHRNLPYPDKINQDIGESTTHSASQEISGAIKITIDKGLISLKVVQANLQVVLKRLSEISGVPIIILDPSNTISNRVSLTLDRVLIHEAVKKILNQLPSGGLSTVTGAKGSDAVISIYVITKKGANEFQVDADIFLERIKKGEKPHPQEVANWLTMLFSTFGIVDPQGTSMYAIPVLLMVNENYELYKDMVLKLFLDRKTPEAVRVAMLEIISNHWNNQDAEKTVRLVFMNLGESPILLGRSAETLAGHGVNIGYELMRRYELADPEAKFYYAAALSFLGRKEAIPLLKDDLEKSEDIALKASIIRSLGRLDPDGANTVEAFDQIVHSSSTEYRPPEVPVDTNVEVLSMQVVLAMAQSKKSETYRRLLKVAGNDTLPVDVRLTAVESLQITPKDKASEVIDALIELTRKVIASKSLDEVDKDRFSRLIRHVTKKLSTK